MFAPPKWQSKTIVIPEAPDEEHTVWFRSLLEVADWLFANPMFEGEMGYRPEEIYEADGRTRIYHEMWTGDDWRAWQVRVKAEVLYRWLVNESQDRSGYKRPYFTGWHLGQRCCRDD